MDCQSLYKKNLFCRNIKGIKFFKIQKNFFNLSKNTDLLGKNEPANSDKNAHDLKKICTSLDKKNGIR